MPRIFKFAMRTAGAVGAMIVVAGIGATVTYSIASTIVKPEDPLWGDLRCFAGYPLQSEEKCLQEKLEDAIRENEAAFKAREKAQADAHRAREEELGAILGKSREEVAELARKSKSLESEKEKVVLARAAMEERLKTMEAIESRVSSFNLFTSKAWRGGLSVTTGVEYSSFVKAQEWSHSWCYMPVKAASGVEIHLKLAKQFKGKMMEPDAVTDTELSAVSLTRADIDQARLLCSFPDATS